MKFSQIKLTEAEKRLKEELRAMGQDLERRAQAAQEKFEPTIAKLYDETAVAQPARRPLAMFNWFKRPLVLAPVGIVALVLAVGIARRSGVSYLAVPPFDRGSSLPTASEDFLESGQPTGLAPSSYTPETEGEEVIRLEVQAEHGIAAPSRRDTFKDRFLRGLGQHEASPDEIAFRPQVFEQDVYAELITVKSQDEVANAMYSIFGSLGGFVESINVTGRGRDNVSVRGKVPARSLEAFRTMLRNFAGEDKYYREQVRADNRTADVVVIEDEQKKVEDAITYLEEKLAQETDPRRRAELEAELETHRARLRERETTREVIQDRVEYAEVNVAAVLLPTFWRANSLNDFRQLYLGFNEPTLLDQFKINATAFILGLLHALSYFFWVIPIIWWISRRKSRRTEALLKELE